MEAQRSSQVTSTRGGYTTCEAAMQPAKQQLGVITAAMLSFASTACCYMKTNMTCDDVYAPVCCNLPKQDTVATMQNAHSNQFSPTMVG